MNTVIYNVLCACFGLLPSSSQASALLREAYQDPENAPQPPQNTNVIYYSTFPDAGAAESPPSYAGENPKNSTWIPSVSQFAAWILQIVCYGPDAPDNARKIRAFLYLDGAGFPRAILRKAGIYPVPNPPEPLVLHEPEGSLWRLRADLTIRLRVEDKLSHSNRLNMLGAVPAVRIISH